MRAVLIAFIALSCWSCDNGFVGEFQAERSRGDDLRPAGAEAAKPAPAPDLDAEKQRQTVNDMRNLGTAMFSWLTDEVSAAAAGQPERQDVRVYPNTSMAELEKVLVPQYIDRIPRTDGWGHPLDIRLNVKDVLARNVMFIRSPGRDGKYSGDVYKLKGFTPADYDQDIVWADGFFLRWPAR